MITLTFLKIERNLFDSRLIRIIANIIRAANCVALLKKTYPSMDTSNGPHIKDSN